jgi:hypothetical protein
MVQQKAVRRLDLSGTRQKKDDKHDIEQDEMRHLLGTLCHGDRSPQGSSALQTIPSTSAASTDGCRPALFKIVIRVDAPHVRSTLSS